MEKGVIEVEYCEKVRCRGVDCQESLISDKVGEIFKLLLKGNWSVRRSMWYCPECIALLEEEARQSQFIGRRVLNFKDIYFGDADGYRTFTYLGVPAGTRGTIEELSFNKSGKRFWVRWDHTTDDDNRRTLCTFEDLLFLREEDR